MKSSRILTVLYLISTQAFAQNPGTLPENIDFNVLRKLIEQSSKKPEVSSDEQMMKFLGELQFNRSTAGILAARLEESRQQEQTSKDPVENPTPAQITEKLKADAEIFQRDVILGRWDKVGEFLKSMPSDKAAEAYKLVLEKMAKPASVSPPPELAAQGAKPHSQQQFIPPLDLLGLMGAAPTPPDDELTKMLSGLLQRNPRPPAGIFRIARGRHSKLRRKGKERPSASGWLPPECRACAGRGSLPSGS